MSDTEQLPDLTAAAERLQAEQNIARAMALFGATREQVQANYRRNAEVLREMARKAERTGRRVNHYTASELWAQATRYEMYGTITPEGDDGQKA